MIVFNGATGGLGRFLQRALAEAGLKNSPLVSRLEDTQGLRRELDEIGKTLPGENQSTTLIQLAGMVPVALCEKEPSQAFKTNVKETSKTVLAFAEWARSVNRTPRVFYVSTGHVYAAPVAGHKIAEQDAVSPRSTYARTKLKAENNLRALSGKNPRFDLLIGRVFGLLSPQQPPHYVLPGLIRRVNEGNFLDIPGLEYTRDYLDSRDVCAHIAHLCRLDWTVPSLRQLPILNICSGEPISIRDLLLEIVKAVGIDRREIAGQLTASPGRPDDIPWIVGDPGQLCKISRRPARSIPLKETITNAVRGTTN